jgi:hypothetical protein
MEELVQAMMMTMMTVLRAATARMARLEPEPGRAQGPETVTPELGMAMLETATLATAMLELETVV